MSLADPPHRYAFADHPRGGLALKLAGRRIVCRPSGALWVEAARALIVADLHLEKGSAYALRGQMLPPYDTREALSRLEREIDLLAPRLVVFLGDTFHDRHSEGRLAGEDAERLRNLARDRALIFVAGNHDAAGPRDLGGEAAAAMEIDGLLLVHEPMSGPAEAEIAGHLHPCARVRGYAMGVRRRCFITDGERMILPAFGAFAGGLNVRDRAFQSLFRRPPLAALLGAERVHALGWRSLGGD